MNATDIKKLDRLIKLNATGSPGQLAKKLNTSERSVYRIIKQLKEIGCPIYFDKRKKSYCYKQRENLAFKFEIENAEEKTFEEFWKGVFSEIA